MSKRRAVQLYFGKRDDDLWEAIQRIQEGDRNHEMRQALRNYFLGEKIAPKVQTKLTKPKKEDVDISKVAIGLNLIK